MIISVPIQCPACQQMKDSLTFWKTLGNHHFHVCDKCKNKTFDENELLRIGFSHGFDFAERAARDAVNDITKPSL